MNDISRIKKITASICIACLALGGCTEDRLLPDSGTSSTMEPVTVKLTLGIDDYNTSSGAGTRAEEMPPVLRMSSPEMDVEVVATPAATRTVAAPVVSVTEDNAVYSYMGFQFDGTGPDSKLVKKMFFTSPDGSIKTEGVEITATSTGKKNTVVILANVNEKDFESITKVNKSTYADLQNLCMTLATDDGIFPRNKVILPNNGGERTGIVMCGQTAAEITDGKLLYISLKRTVARVRFNIRTTYPHFMAVEHTWSVVLMNIPKQSYYNVLGRKAVFPAESTEKSTGFFWTKLLATTTVANPVIKTDPLYIPVNLQQTVPTSTQITRRDNAPLDGTYLQIVGLENKQVTGANGLDIIKDFSIYQLFLGKNFTTDYSVYPNYDLTYNITLKGNSADDTNVIRLIPGYFSGDLTAYGADGQALLPVSEHINDPNAVKWKYPNKIELHFKDGYYPQGSSSSITKPQDTQLQWYAGVSPFDNHGATSLTDGHQNTALLQAIGVPWKDYAAAYTCYRGTNGYAQGVAAKDILWYLPSVSELIGTWISSASTREQMADGYWSSTANPSANEAFVVTNEGRVFSDAVVHPHAVRASQDPDKASHAGGK